MLPPTGIPGTGSHMGFQNQQMMMMKMPMMMQPQMRYGMSRPGFAGMPSTNPEISGKTISNLQKPINLAVDLPDHISSLPAPAQNAWVLNYANVPVCSVSMARYYAAISRSLYLHSNGGFSRISGLPPASAPFYSSLSEKASRIKKLLPGFLREPNSAREDTEVSDLEYITFAPFDQDSYYLPHVTPKFAPKQLKALYEEDGRIADDLLNDDTWTTQQRIISCISSAYRRNIGISNPRKQCLDYDATTTIGILNCIFKFYVDKIISRASVNCSNGIVTNEDILTAFNAEFK